jgi:hypothetical protein
VLAVLVRFLVRGARAMRVYSITAQGDLDTVRIRIRALDLASRFLLLYGYVLDDASLCVIETSQERTRAEQAPQSAVGQR